MRLLISLVLISSLAAFCVGQSGGIEEELIHNRAHHLAIAAHELYGMPVEKRPTIIWNYDDDWPISAWADCKAWTLTLNHRTAINHLDAMLNKVLPHEFGHFIHCHLNGGTVGMDPHNLQWQFYVTDLGGDPTFF